MSYSHKYRKYGRIKKSCLVQVKELKDFEQFLMQHFTDVNYGGKTVDGTSIQFKNLDELLDYSNFKNRRLVELKLSSAENDKSLGIEFEKRASLVIPETINYSLTYNDQNWGFKFEEDLQNELKEFVPNYNYFTYLDFSFAIPLLVYLSLMGYMAIDYFIKFSGFQGFTNIDFSKSSESEGSSIVVLFWMAFILIGGTIINRFRSYIFPTIFIATGKQIKEYKKRTQYSKVLFGVIILGVLINVLSKWILG